MNELLSESGVSRTATATQGICWTQEGPAYTRVFNLCTFVCLSICLSTCWSPNWSQWVQMGLNESTLVQMGPIGSKWIQISPNGSKWIQMGQKESKLVQMDPNGSKWVQIGPNWSKLVQIGLNRSNRSNLVQIGQKWSKIVNKKGSKMVENFPHFFQNGPK